MAILQKYGILTNPAYDEGAQDSPPVEQAPVQAAPTQAPQQPIPTIRQPQPTYRPNPLRMAQERGLQQSLLRQENRPAPTGFWGKAGHILSNVANAAGNVILGGANMAMIPGTQQNAAAQHTATMGELQGLEKQDQQEEQQFGQEQLRGAQAHEAEARAGSLENPPDKPDKFSFQQTDHGLMRIDSVTGEATPVTFNGQVLQPKPAVEKDTKITEDLQNQIDAANQAGDTAKVQQLQKRLRDLNPAAEQKFAFTVNQAGQKNDAADQKRTDAEAKITRQDVLAHDKAYVQPADAVEKSYQMMDHAYQEFENARKQGKVLPTGAQSMLALSTHLSTTFGNVKGARVTKDMIEHHLGARGISDSAVVAVQRLTNGDTLSPAQWQAFHDLIRQSRNLSWGTAVKEAARKHIPVDFLPQDLQSRTVNGTPYDLGADGQFHKRVQ